MDALTRFKSWVKQQPGPRRETAARIGCAESTLGRIINGERYPSGEIAALIEFATAEDPEPIRAVEWYPRPKRRATSRKRRAA